MIGSITMSSSPPVTEIATLHVGSNFNEEAFKPVIKIVKEFPGTQNFYWGRTAENPNMVILFVEWDSIEHHEAFRAHEIFKTVHALLIELVDLSNPNPLSFYHVPFQPFPPAKAMAGPIIELGQITAKDEQGVPDEMSEVIAGIFSAANNHPKCLGSAKGICVEDKSKLVIALAWESVEAHMEDFRSTKEYGEASKPLGQYVKEAGFVHVQVNST